MMSNKIYFIRKDGHYLNTIGGDDDQPAFNVPESVSDQVRQDTSVWFFSWHIAKDIAESYGAEYVRADRR